MDFPSVRERGDRAADGVEPAEPNPRTHAARTRERIRTLTNPAQSFESPHIEPAGSQENPPATVEDFQRFLRHTQDLAEGGQDLTSLRAWLDLAEAWRITQALRDCNGNRSAAARLLGIGRRTLYAKMDKLGIEPSWRI